MRRLYKGIHLPDGKSASLLTPQIHRISPPRFVRFPLVQHAGPVSIPCVEENKPVFVGTKIAEGVVPIHSSVSGRVAEITPRSIRIESDEAMRFDPAIEVCQKAPLNPDELVRMIREAGVVGLGGDAYPTHLRLIEARSQNVETVILNGCESEPFLTADYLLMINHPIEILKGAELLRLACGASRVVIVTSDRDLEAVEILKSRNYNLRLQTVDVLALDSFYPQGDERVLTEQFFGRPLGRSETPASVGFMVENVATAFAVCEAVYLGKPLVERVVTVSGACVAEPKNVWAPFGASIQDLVRACKGFLREPKRLILGGPMRGRAVSSSDIPLTKKVQGILALPPEQIDSSQETDCIRCGRCADACPERLVPETLVRAIRAGDRDLMEEFEIAGCSECGKCAYVCPSKIPIVELIRTTKDEIVSFEEAPLVAELFNVRASETES